MRVPGRQWGREEIAEALMVTSRDIARMAGVSQSTVSRVLHDHPSIRPETRARVLRVLRETDYSPHKWAQAMVTKKTGTIGVVVEDITNPFYPEIVEALAGELAGAGRRMMLWNSREAGEPSAIEAIRQRLVDGVVFTTATRSSRVLQEAVRYGSPVVLVNRYVEGITCDRVTTDNVSGGLRIADYFVHWGHERIALIVGLEEASTSAEREAGFRAGLTSGGIELEPDLRRVGGYSVDLSYQAMTKLLKQPHPPTAVFCVNDLMAFGALNAAQAVGARVPEDVWVVGFDDIPMSSWELFDLTTVSQPIPEMVREAVRLLMRRIEEPERPTEHLRLGGSEVIVRGSTAHKAPKR